MLWYIRHSRSGMRGRMPELVSAPDQATAEELARNYCNADIHLSFIGVQKAVVSEAVNGNQAAQKASK